MIPPAHATVPAVRIAVMGTGGVGGYFGGQLARAGEAVAFVARGEHLRAIRAGGLAVESVEGNFTVAAPATDDPVQVPALIGPIDLVLVCVKPEVVRAFLEGLYEAVAHMKANKEYTVELFQRKMDTPRDIGARVWEFDAHKLVDDGLFSDKALLTAAQAIVETGAIKEVPPLSTWVDKRFLPVRWKR